MKWKGDNEKKKTTIPNSPCQVQPRQSQSIGGSETRYKKNEWLIGFRMKAEIAEQQQRQQFTIRSSMRISSSLPFA